MVSTSGLPHGRLSLCACPPPLLFLLICTRCFLLGTCCFLLGVASFTTQGDKRTGCTRVLYDTTFSERGALLAVSRAPRVANPFDVGLPLVIKTPHALPMYREEPGRKRSREKARQVSALWGSARTRHAALAVAHALCASVVAYLCRVVNAMPALVVTVH